MNHDEEANPTQNNDFSLFFNRSSHLSVFIKKGSLIAKEKPDPYFEFNNFETVLVGGKRKRLGKGAFGEVYKVKSKIDGKFFAVKQIMKAKIIENGLKLSNIKQEIKIHTALNHENVIRLYDWHEDDDNFYLVVL